MSGLFSRGELRDLTQRRHQDAVSAVGRLPPEEVRFSPEQAVDAVVAEHRLEPVRVLFDEMTRSEVREETPTVQDFGRSVRLQGQVVTIHVPVTGESQLLEYRASRAYVAPIGGRVQGKAVSFDVRGTPLTQTGAQQEIERMRKYITDAADWANSDVAVAETSMRIGVKSAVDARREALDQAAALSASLDIPLTPASGERRIDIPVVRKTMRVVDRRNLVSGEEPRLADAVYEDVLRTISAIARAFERLPRTASKFNEGELRDLILFVLNANYEGLARGEVFNGTGKTDILLPYKDRNAFIAECKVWNGPAKFEQKALDQLLGYTVWRDTKAALVLFIRSAAATEIISKADEIIRRHPSFRTAHSASEPDTRRDYLVTSTSDSQRYIRLALLPLIIH